MDSAQYRRQMTGNMPTGEYKPGDMELTISHKSIEESQINESDYEPDAWIAIVEELKRWPK